MEQLEIMSGFHDLKDLLIISYKLTKNRDSIKLHFTEYKNELLMHDYDDHKKLVQISRNVASRATAAVLSNRAQYLIEESLRHKSPSKFLNDQFQLYGFFRS